jgi:lysine-N-methylase
MADVPSRPRLADHVLARRYIADGKESIVLWDLRAGRVLQVGPREWELLASADGTRDLQGILLAAEREGALARPEALRAFVSELHAAGLLEDGIRALSRGDETDEDDVPVEALPSFSLHCDGRGSCCRMYPTVLFTPREAVRARALVPDVLDGGDRHGRVFLPDRGTDPRGGSAVTLCGGACAYLSAEGSCRVHEVGGAEAKPLGCRLFPAILVDDGTRVRVTPMVECACVLASIGREGGAPLLSGGARTRRELDPAVHVARVPEVVEVNASLRASRAELAAWSSAVLAEGPPRDAAAAFWTLAGLVNGSGLSIVQVGRSLHEARAPLAGDVRRCVEDLEGRASRRRALDAGWRSADDLALRGTAWIERACKELLAGEIPAAPVDPAQVAREHFYYRVTLWGHRLAGEGAVADALRDRAVRLWVARSLAALFARGAGPDHEALREPIATVEATVRGQGFAGARSPPVSGDR